MHYISQHCNSVLSADINSVHPLPSMQRTTTQKVIVMELCTGGSLYEVIDSPENAFGLSEVEFKQVIHDIGECYPGDCLAGIHRAVFDHNRRSLRSPMLTNKVVFVRLSDSVLALSCTHRPSMVLCTGILHALRPIQQLRGGSSHCSECVRKA